MTNRPPNNLYRMMVEVDELLKEKGWRDRIPTVGEQIALIHSEVSEMLEAYRVYGTHMHTDENGKPDDIASEAADVLIRLLDFCALHGIDLEWEYERKMAYNRGRSYRHGGKVL